MPTKLLQVSPDPLLTPETIAMLENEHGVVVQHVESMDDFYLQLSQKQPLIILLDDEINLLGINDQIAEDLAHDPSVMVILLSQKDHPLPNAMNNLIDARLQKPLDPQVLQAVLNDYFRISQQDVPTEQSGISESQPLPVWVSGADMAQHYMEQYFAEIQAHGAFIYHEGEVWADAGRLQKEDLQNLMLLIAGNWNAQNNYDLVKYVKLNNSNRQFCLYVTQIRDDYLLACIYDVFMAMSQMRTQSAHLNKRLAAVLFKQHVAIVGRSHPVVDGVQPEEAAAPLLDELLKEEPPVAATFRPKSVSGGWSAQSQPDPVPFVQAKATVAQMGWLLPLLRNVQAQQEKQRAWQALAAEHEKAVAIQKGKEVAQAKLQQANSEKTLPPFGLRKGYRLPWEAGGEKTNPENNAPADFLPENDLSPLALTTSQRNNLAKDATYTVILVPRPALVLTGDIATLLQDCLRAVSQAYTWELKESKIQPTWLQFSIATLAEVSQGKIVRIIREYTSHRLQAEKPGLRSPKGMGDLWSPGYLASRGINTIPQSVIENFIKQVTSRQNQPGA